MYGHNGDFELQNSESIITLGPNKEYPICGVYTFLFFFPLHTLDIPHFCVGDCKSPILGLVNELFTWKPLDHGSRESLISHCLRVSLPPPPGFRFTQGWFWYIAYNIFNGWKIYMESHMASIANVG